MSAADYVLRAFYPNASRFSQTKPRGAGGGSYSNVGSFKGKFGQGTFGAGPRLRRVKVRRGVKGRSSYKARRGKPTYARKRWTSRASASSRKGASRAAKINTLVRGIAEDRFTERLVTQHASTSSENDHQVIGLTSTSHGIDMNVMKNLCETAFAASPSSVLNRILIYNHERIIRIHPLTNIAQHCEVTRWVPRYDNDQTALQMLALVSATDTNAADYTIIGAKLFDSRMWTTAFKAVKTYHRILQRGRAWTIKTRRKWPKGKLIDYLGEWRYTLASRPSGAFTFNQFMLKKGLSNIYTYRIWGAQAAASVSHDVHMVGPCFYIEDQQTVHYTPTLLNAKSNFDSLFNATLHAGTDSTFISVQEVDQATAAVI